MQCLFLSPTVMADNPKASFEEVAKIITKKWRLQSLEDIAKYKEQAEAMYELFL